MSLIVFRDHYHQPWSFSEAAFVAAAFYYAKVTMAYLPYNHNACQYEPKYWCFYTYYLFFIILT